MANLNLLPGQVRKYYDLVNITEYIEHINIRETPNDVITVTLQSGNKHQWRFQNRKWCMTKRMFA